MDYDCRRRLLQAQHRDRRSPGLWKRILQRRRFDHHYESYLAGDFFDPVHNFDALLKEEMCGTFLWMVQAFHDRSRISSSPPEDRKKERSILFITGAKPETKQNTKIL